MRWMMVSSAPTAFSEDEFTDLMLVTESWVKWDAGNQVWVGADKLQPEERVVASVAGILEDLKEARDKYAHIDYTLRQASIKLDRLANISESLAKTKRED